MSEINKSLRAIFNEALEIADAKQRGEYLAQACGADTALRQSIEELIQANNDAGGFLGGTGGATRQATQKDAHGTVVPAPISEQPGDKIGRYKLLQKIGEGGCGVVYMAEQAEPVRRRVALKVIKLGMDTKNVIARFEAERQALALMDHPNIAKVLDAGATETGRPYFVMELVKGVRITDYCDQNSLPTIERLALFTLVCHAIQHAHQKGIIHRDIKPSNILVTLHDGVPVPKVIDFGIAKATSDQRLTDKTLFTAFEQFMGTPAYMSPEQAEMSGLDIDTRSDIYALGVLLYELLTGQTPFDARELLASGLDAMRRTIREQEPARPSTRLSTMLAEDLTAIAKHRQTESAKLTSAIRGDLDWIVMKALEKDRTRRYDTANGLAMDIARHLSNEPVVARPPSNLYRFQKLARRNKLAFAAVAAISTVLVLGVVVSTSEAIRAKRAERLAETARVAEVEQRSEAEKQRASAEANFQKARKTVDEYFTTISETTLLEAPGLQPLRKVLLEAALSYYQGFLEQGRANPELLADLAAAHLRLSVVYVSLNRCDDALAAILRGLELVEQVRQKRPGDTNFPRRLGGFFKTSGNIFYHARPPSDPVKAARTLQKAAEIWAQFAREDPTTVEFESDLAGFYVLLSALFEGGDDFDQCLAFTRQARAILEKLVRARPAVSAYQDLLIVNSGQSSTPKLRKARPDEIEQLLRQLVRYFEDLANEFPADLSMRRSLARVDVQLADALLDTQPSEAESIYRRALGLLESLVADSTSNANYRKELYETYNYLSGLLSKAGRNEEAEVLAGKAFPINEQLVLEFPGMPDYRLDLAKRHLALAERMKESHPAEAEQASRRAQAIYERLVADFPGQYRFTDELTRNYHLLADTLYDQGKWAEAEALCLKAIALSTQSAQADPKRSYNTMELGHTQWRLADVLAKTGRPDQAFQVLREAVQTFEKVARDFPSELYLRQELAFSHRKIGDMAEAAQGIDEAERHYRVAVSLYAALKSEAPGSAFFHQEEAHTSWLLAGKLQRAGRLEAAVAEYRKALTLHEEWLSKFPKDKEAPLRLASIRASLASLLRSQGKLPEAETLFREALATHRKLYANEHPQVAESLQSLSFVLRQEGKLPEAETTAREALAIRKKLHGDEHANVAYALHLLAWNLNLQGNHAEAEGLSRKEVATWRKLLGNDDPNVAWALGDLTIFLRDQQKLPEAETAIRESLAIRHKRLGNTHPDTVNSFNLLLDLLRAQGKLAEAKALIKPSPTSPKDE